MQRLRMGTGFVLDESAGQARQDIVRVRFLKDMEERMINMDETHQDICITGIKGGSRAVTYHNPLL